MPAVGNGGSSPPVSAAAIRPKSGWWPTRTTRSPRPAAARRASAEVAPGREPLVGHRLEAAGAGEHLGGLPRAQERARHDRVGPLAGEALGEQARLLPALRGERAQLVGIAGGGLRVADEVEAHVGTQHRRTLPRVTCPACDRDQEGGAF